MAISWGADQRARCCPFVYHQSLPVGPQREPPYVLALIELEEQPGLRLLSALVGCQNPTVGMEVHVAFEPAGEA
ncbi:OB-fold domain-containing protein [Mycobacterium colombiense]